MFGNIEDSSEPCARNNVEISNYISNVNVPDMGICDDDDYDMGIQKNTKILKNYILQIIYNFFIDYFILLYYSNMGDTVFPFEMSPIGKTTPENTTPEYKSPRTPIRIKKEVDKEMEKKLYMIYQNLRELSLMKQYSLE